MSRRAFINTNIFVFILSAALLLPTFAYASIGTISFAQNGQLWDTGEDVRALQQFLNAQGFIVAQSGAGSPGHETSTFGIRTYQAVRKFQTAHGLPATGFFGPLTRAVANSTLPSSASTTTVAPTTPAPTSTVPTPPTPPIYTTPPPTPAIGQPWSAPSGGGGGGGDSTPPVITETPSNITAEATSGSGAAVTYANPTATDNVDGATSVSCSPSSGSTFVIGTTTVTCSATDRAGNTAHNSFTITVQDTTAPSASITAPANGATVSGLTVTVSASASDLVGVAGVQFKLDTNTNIGSEDTSSPYSISWDSTGVSDGSHTIIAVARDAAGNYATSSSITVTTANSAGSADLYWVGGSGNWSDPHHWATSSGSTGQYLPPTTSNIVHFDSNSSASSYTVTINTAANTATTTVANPTTGSPTFAGSAAWTNSGGLTLVSGMGWTYTGTMTFNSTSLGQTITTAGVTLSNDITFNGVGGGWTNQDNLTDGSSNKIKLIAGIWNTNAKTVTTGLVDVGSVTTSARTATFTNSTFNLTGSSADVWFLRTTNLTRTLTGSTINLQGSNAGFNGGNNAYATVNLTGGGTMPIAGGNSFTALSVVGTTAKTDSVTFPNSTTNSVSGTLTLSGNSQTTRLFVKTASTGGIVATISAAAKSISNVDFQGITASGVASPFTGTSIGDGTGNTNITVTTPVTRYWVGGTGNFSDISHWAASTGGAGGATMPLLQDTANFDANSFSGAGQVVTVDVPRIGTIDFTGATNAPTFNIENAPPQFINDYGNLTLATGMLMAGNATISWSHNSGTKTFTSNGVAFTGAVQVQGVGGTLQLGSDLDCVWMVVNGGTFDAANHNVTIRTNFTSYTTNTRAVLMGSGNWTFTYNGTGAGSGGGYFWSQVSSGMTLTPGASTMILNGSSPVAQRNFLGGGLTYGKFEWQDEGGSSTLNITGNNTFSDFKIDGALEARTLKLPSSGTQTSITFELAGTTGSLLSIQSSTPGTKATLSQASGTVSGDYLSIQDSAATGGATFNATNSVDAGNNSGWTFP